jgi:mannosylglycerate hydrolase
VERAVEPVAVIASLLGIPYPTRTIEEAWKFMLKNHPHDSICGVSIDDVHTDMEERYDRAEELLNFEWGRLLKMLTVQVNTASIEAAVSDTLGEKPVTAFVVFNTLASPQDSIVFVPAASGDKWRFIDEKNEALESVTVQNGYRVFVKNIPPLGYTTIYAKSSEKRHLSPAQTDSSYSQTHYTLENALLCADIHPDGSLSVLDKITNARYDGLLVFEDGADAGDEYNYSPLKNETLYYSTAYETKIRRTEDNELRQTCVIETTMRLPCSLSADRATRSEQVREFPLITRVTLDKDSPVLRFTTTLRNTVKDHRLSVLFPTDIESEVSYSQTQFDVTLHPINPPPYQGQIPDMVKRVINGAYEPNPSDIFPQLSFAGISDGQRGIALINKGLPEYRVIPERNTIALTLFRAIG